MNQAFAFFGFGERIIRDDSLTHATTRKDESERPVSTRQVLAGGCGRVEQAPLCVSP